MANLTRTPGLSINNMEWNDVCESIPFLHIIIQDPLIDTYSTIHYRSSVQWSRPSNNKPRLPFTPRASSAPSSWREMDNRLGPYDT